MEVNTTESEIDFLQRRLDFLQSENVSKEDTIRSLASRINEAVSTLAAFDALSVHVAPVPIGSLGKIIVRILTAGPSNEERDALIRTQIRYNSRTDE